MILNWELREVLPEFRPEGRLNVLLALILHANVRLRCWPSVERLCDETGFFKEAVTAAKKWLLDRGAIVLVPYGHRMGAEKRLPPRQHVYQLTGVVRTESGQLARYLYLTPEAEKDLHGLLTHEADDLSPAEEMTPEVPQSENLPVENSAVEREVGSTSQGGSTLSSSDAADAALAEALAAWESKPKTPAEQEAKEADEQAAHGIGVPPEPRYVDDVWESDRPRPKWSIPDGNDKQLMRALAAGKRRFFQLGEKARWKQIRQAMTARTMSAAWVDNCIDFAQRNGKITFPNLLTYIQNTEKMVDWERRHAQQMA